MLSSMKLCQVFARVRKQKSSYGTTRGVKVALESVILVIYFGYHVIIQHPMRPPYSRSLFSIRKIFSQTSGTIIFKFFLSGSDKKCHIFAPLGDSITIVFFFTRVSFSKRPSRSGNLYGSLVMTNSTGLTGEITCSQVSKSFLASRIGMFGAMTRATFLFLFCNLFLNLFCFEFNKVGK